MKKLVVNDDGKIILDGSEINKEKFSSEFLIQIFKDKMNNEVEFELSDKTAISQIFKSIEATFKEGNPFIDQYKEAKKNAEKYKKELDQLKIIKDDNDKLE